LYSHLSSLSDAYERARILADLAGMLARVDEKGAYRLFYVDETLFSRGPHARVTCTGCHADINKIPHDHAQPVDCLRNCHIQEPTREIMFTHFSMNSRIVTTPAFYQGVFHPKMIEYPSDYHVHKIVYRFRLVVESRAGRQNGCPGIFCGRTRRSSSLAKFAMRKRPTSGKSFLILIPKV
jgi:hypothetical protein